MKRSTLFMFGCATALAVPGAVADCTQPAASSTPYPTSVVAEYVLGCMLSNGVSPETLEKCSYSFDFVADAIPYEQYEQVQTLMRLQQMPGTGRVAVYKSSNWAKNAVTHLREVQAESTLRCF